MLKFSKEKVVGTAVIEISLTENDVETIMVNSMEGAIRYWAGLDNSGSNWEAKPKDEPLSTWATKLLLEGKEVKFYDVEDENENWTLTLEKLINGYSLNAKNRPSDSNIDNGDATTFDCIIQYALFNELVFG